VAGVARRSRSGPRPHGRHFLRSRALAATLVADAGIGGDDLVLDLGAGRGALTGELARRARRAWAVELDPSLAEEVRRRFDGTNVRVLHADATRLRWPEEPFKVVANIPFDRTGAILRRLLDDPRVPLVRGRPPHHAARRAAGPGA
jgi:23S rRNA (adenine-N6)-dimethyltransferase